MRWAKVGDIMLNKTALGVAISAALSFSVSATVQPIEKITVTANKFEQPISNVLASVSVIDRADIEKSNVRNLPSLLASQAGFQINSNGGFGQNSGVSLRGSSSRHTLILIDGVRVGSATLGYKGISNIALNTIERIEVVKGSRAAVYGSDALAGVINIITRKADNIRLDATFGSNAYQSYQMAGGTNINDLSASFNAGIEKTDGFDVLQNHAPDEDAYENKNIGFNIAYNDDYLGKLTVQTQYNEGYARYDNQYSAADSSDESNDFENYQVSLGWNKSYENQIHHIAFAFSSDSQDNTSEGVVSMYETKRNQIDYTGQYIVSDELNINGGLNWYKDKIETNAGNYDKDSREVFAGFLGAYYDDNTVLANIAVRQDHDQQFGDKTTYTAAVGYHLNKFATFRASQSTGFKSPTFNDIYFPGSGNPDLKPETSENKELGLLLSYQDIALEVSIFRNDFDNKIAWAPTPAGPWQPTNINEARHEGIEFSFSQQLMGFEHAFNFTYLSAEDLETGQELAYVSKNTFNWSLNKGWGDFDAGIDLQYRGDRKGKLTDLSSYTLWNLVGNYQATEQLSFSLRVENLFDKQYDEVDAYGIDLDGDYINDEFYYYNTADRRLFIGAAYQF